MTTTNRFKDVSFHPSAARAHLHTPPELARDQHILVRFVSDARVCGVVGEDRNLQLIFLALTSRIGDDPVSLAIKGLSSSGKSYTTETTVRFFPETAYLAMTAMSEKALVYSKESYEHRTIVLYEAVALREEREKVESNQTAYFVRSLLSEGQIRYQVAVRDSDGNFTTKTIIKQGPTNLVVTTTATSLHGENETRLLSLPTNDTQEQTKAVLLQLAEGTPHSIDFERWHALQSWLEVAEHRVTIPYARFLAESIPPVAVRLRRDFKAVLKLIETHAMLHQLNRARDADGRIVANEDDYLAVRDLVGDLISDGIGTTVSATMRETVKTVRKLAGKDGVTVKDVADALGIDRTTAQRRLQGAREKGHVVNLEERRGQPARYAPGDDLPDEIKLLPPHAHRTSEDPSVAGQDGVCTCARTAEGIHSGDPEADYLRIQRELHETPPASDDEALANIESILGLTLAPAEEGDQP